MAAIINHNTFAPMELSGFSPKRDMRSTSSDDSMSSDDGSLGPRELIAPYVQKATMESTSTSVASTVRAPARPVAPKLTTELLSHAMTFMPLSAIEVARTATPALASAAERVAPKPLGTDEAVFVRWEPQELRTAIHPAPQKRRGAPPVAAPAVFPWRCLSCGNVSAGPRQCQHCRTPLALAACRVFLGQLRKDLSAELATAMIRSLAPQVTILHIEAHTNGADGRGKGCAWAYVNSVEDALRLLALHKRVFVDIDADGSEGFWFVKHADMSAQLCGMADAVGAGRGRPVYLPRQPLVAELPGKSMLAEYVKTAALTPIEF